MSSTNEKIGHLIYQIRQERGLTQAEFARKLSTSQSAVNRIEHGKQNLSLETLGRISDVLNKKIISIGEGGINLRIEGGHELHGEISVKTSKNATVGLLCAALLNRGTTRLKNVPRIEEVNRIIEVLISIGVHVRWLANNDLEIKPPAVLDLDSMNKEAARKTRTVIMFIGPLMHQFNEFKIPYAGGCELGRRTVLPHLYALEEFGVDVLTKSGHYNITVNKHPAKRSIVLYESGDTTTENALMAAACIDSETTIKMASANYSVQDVCFFLQKLGVRIDGIGTTTLKVHGVKRIKKNVTYAPSEDPVEAMTFIAAAVTTNSSITVKRVPLEFTELELLKLEKMGLKFKVSNSYKAENGKTDLVDVKIFKHDGQLIAPMDKIYGRPFPGLNIDNLPYFVPIAAVAKGRTLIHDWVYEDRALMYTEMKKIGVDIELADPHRAFISGPTRWRAADIVSPSGIRPAVMLLIGMLAAPGESILRNVYTINRGYEDLAARLDSLGAKITITHDI
ncbi:MAG TPA: UDP-N-acetylglucosamine 1-carboxyvinyltransferase [Candidatus Saccharimonadales bacterium]|nr:UDP-N-acetylglucosamine 1-carboxyvinyltransferase [Candidatus Saccharimonadales bacterium]